MPGPGFGEFWRSFPFRIAGAGHILLPRACGLDPPPLPAVSASPAGLQMNLPGGAMGLGSRSVRGGGFA